MPSRVLGPKCLFAETTRSQGSRSR